MPIGLALRSRQYGDRVSWRWNDDICMIAKAGGQKIARLYPIIGAIGNEAGNRVVDLVEKVRQGRRITDLIRGQLAANNLTAEQIKPEM